MMNKLGASWCQPGQVAQAGGAQSGSHTRCRWLASYSCRWRYTQCVTRCAWLLHAGPFSQRVLITLEEKGVPYTYKLVDTSNKPEW